MLILFSLVVLSRISQLFLFFHFFRAVYLNNFLQTDNCCNFSILIFIIFNSFMNDDIQLRASQN